MNRSVEEREYQRVWQSQSRRERGIPTREAVRETRQAKILHLFIQVHGDKYDYSLAFADNTKSHIVIKCPQHGAFEQSRHAHARGQGCPNCAMGRRLESNKSRAVTAGEQFISKANMVHNGIYDYSCTAYVGVHDKIEIMCLDHGSFLQSPAAHLRGQGCPHCANDRRARFAESRGEAAIQSWLEARGISFEKQKTFDGCVDRSALRFDFYIPAVNTVIEFDGEQHYAFVKKFHVTQEGFDRCKRRDTIKNEYVVSHKINMLRIKYSDEKLIDKILTESIIMETISENRNAVLSP